MALAKTNSHFRFEKHDRAACLRFGPIEGSVGVAHQRLRILPIDGIYGAADTEADAQLLTLDLEIFSEGREQTLRECGCGPHSIKDDKCEFVTADACKKRFSGDRFQATCDLAQQSITDAVTVDVIGIFEVVKVDAQNDKLLIVPSCRLK